MIPSLNESPSLPGGGGGGGCDHHDHHSHQSHSHSHHRTGGGGNVEMTHQQQHAPPSMDDLVNSSKEEIALALSTLIRFGRYEAMAPLLDQLEEKGKMEDQLQTLDKGGHSLYHWAAKRVDDIRFLHWLAHRTLCQKTMSGCDPSIGPARRGASHVRPSSSSTGQTWRPEITVAVPPSSFAAQYGQAEVVAYLLKKGANIQAVDTSMDTALHWAPYKGSIHVRGLLAYYQALSFSTQGMYEQTPVHLAALRPPGTYLRCPVHHPTPSPSQEGCIVRQGQERT